MTITSRPTLTHQQAQVLAYMATFLGMNDQLPPLKSIAQAFGWASQNSAWEHVEALEKKGYLARNEIGNIMLADRPPPTVVYVDPEVINPSDMDTLRAYAQKAGRPVLCVAQPARGV